MCITSPRSPVVCYRVKPVSQMSEFINSCSEVSVSINTGQEDTTVSSDLLSQI